LPSLALLAADHDVYGGLLLAITASVHPTSELVPVKRTSVLAGPCRSTTVIAVILGINRHPVGSGASLPSRRAAIAA
jgi:hypothetical protein